MIVLVVTPEEAALIRDSLPPGLLRDHVAGQVTVDTLIPAPIPELVIVRPLLQMSEEIFDEVVADVLYQALIAILDRRGESMRAEASA